MTLRDILPVVTSSTTLTDPASQANAEEGQEIRHKCTQPNCGKMFSTNYTLRRHQKLVHGLALSPSSKGPKTRYTTEELKKRNVRGVQKYRLNKRMRKELSNALSPQKGTGKTTRLGEEEGDTLPLSPSPAPPGLTPQSNMSLLATAATNLDNPDTPSTSKMSVSFLVEESKHPHN
jgi:hypothetical protein